MLMTRNVISILLFMGLMPVVYAADSNDDTNTAASYIGSTLCATCHQDRNKSFMASRHGKTFTNHPDNTLMSQDCEACHGPGSEHIKAIGDKDRKGSLMIRNFKYQDDGAATNRPCLVCHEGGKHLNWQGSPHEISNINCTGCHDIHTSGKTTSQDRCLSCHLQIRAQIQRSSHLPIREGMMSCMNCHNPHGGIGPAQLKTSSINESCYRCHAEKRGPLLWEHAPVRENCANCHDPHGSNHYALLKTRPPTLCQQCHAMTFHPSTPYDRNKLASADKHQIGRSCVNCHSQIHGSNHPSGARLMR